MATGVGALISISFINFIDERTKNWKWTFRCGWGNHGSTVFDKTDECCKVHDLCYDKIDEGLFGCSPKFHVYDWKPTDNGGIICQDQIGSCYRKICDCDRFAADCYALHRKTYNLTYLDQYFPFDKREACQWCFFYFILFEKKLKYSIFLEKNKQMSHSIQWEFVNDDI